jgi:hypothetical protein
MIAGLHMRAGQTCRWEQRWSFHAVACRLSCGNKPR